MHREQNAAYYHARQACYTCLETHDVIDTGVQIEGEGVLALCRNCVAQMAKTLGFELDGQSASLLADRDAELSDTRARLVEADNALAVLARSGSDAVKRQMARAREARKSAVDA